MTPTYTNTGQPGPPLSTGDQITWLLRRGMSIPNQSEATHFLSNVNFYRFRGYLEPFVDPASGTPRNFQTGTTFDDAVELYNFDSRLRTLFLDAFNHIEVSIQTQWTYTLAYVGNGGEYSHQNPSLFSQGYSQNLAHLHSAYQRHGIKNHSYHFLDWPDLGSR